MLQRSDCQYYISAFEMPGADHLYFSMPFLVEL